jgi:formylglycine-generating enzyme required for sulfatase activity
MKRFLIILNGLLFILTACTSQSTSAPLTATPFMEPTPTSAPGTRTDEKGVAQVWVPAGSFMMGAIEAEQVDPPGFARAEMKSEYPLHEVQISKGFWIDTYEVTVGSFKQFAEAGGYEEKAYWSEAGLAWLSEQSIESLKKRCSYLAENLPRACVTWFEAEAYAAWRGGRLPTEAEWEYAASGPESLIYPWGNEFDETLANIIDSPGLKPVGSYPGGVSWAGVHDMSGNAMEWVQDWVDFEYYATSPSVDPQGPETGKTKIEKGGWWGSNAYVARAAYHHFEDPPEYQDLHIGFRIVIEE